MLDTFLLKHLDIFQELSREEVEAVNGGVGPIDDDPWIKFCFYNVPAKELDDCINGFPSRKELPKNKIIKR